MASLKATTYNSLMNLHGAREDGDGFIINGKIEKKIGNNTVSSIYDDEIIITLHNSSIVRLRKDNVFFRLAGWNTVTTRERINQFLPEHWRLFTEKFVPYLQYFGDPERKLIFELDETEWVEVSLDHFFGKGL